MRWAARLALLLLMPLGLASAGAEQTPDWRRDWDSLRRASAGIRSVQAKFVQSKQLAILKEPLRSSGRLIFEAPRSLRWEYEEPIASVLLLSAGASRRYLRRDESWLPDASERIEAMRFVLDEIRLWLAGRYEDSENFKAQLRKDPSPHVRLEPRSPELAKLIEAIELHLAEAPGQLAWVEIIEGPKAKTILEFSEVRLNAALEPGLLSRP